MHPPIRERLGVVAGPYPAVEGRPDAGPMARSMMYLFAAGAVAASVSLLAAPAGTSLPRIAAIGGCALALAVFVLVAYDRIPIWGFQAVLAAGAVLVAWAVYAGGEVASPCAMFFLWIAIYAFHFLSRARAWLQMVFIAVAYFGVLVALGDLTATPVLHWALVTGIVVVAGVFTAVQHTHLERLIDRLTDAARTDSLTGLLNRRGFEDLFATELERARRTGRPLSVIICDLDSFKAVNDRFGHAAGDRALEQLSGILRRAKRRIDTAARVGGEEFAVIAPDSDQHAAYILAERMRREVRERFAAEPYTLTLSLGLATFPRHGAYAEALIGGADEALYAAKKLGRDRTVVFNPEIAETLLAATGRPSARFERQGSTVAALAEVSDVRDSGTPVHSQTVGRYAGAIAGELGFPQDVIERVRFGGIVHDVGKIGVSDSILSKPGFLSDDDWREVRQHPEIGARILRGEDMDDIGSWVLAHHERLDGDGYPRGLAADEIPLEARILAVADAYEAMTSDRVYRPALSPEMARDELRSC